MMKEKKIDKIIKINWKGSNFWVNFRRGSNFWANFLIGFKDLYYRN